MAKFQLLSKEGMIPPVNNSKFIQERIISITEKELSFSDIQKLKEKRFRQMRIYLPAFLFILFAAITPLIVGPESVNIGRIENYNKIDIDEDFSVIFYQTVPYVCGAAILIVLIIFTRIYLQVFKPLNLDIKQRKKHLIFFCPKKTEMAFFKRFYISTPICDKQQLEISAGDFYGISDHHAVCLEIAPVSMHILRLKQEGKEINYW